MGSDTPGGFGYGDPQLGCLTGEFWSKRVFGSVQRASRHEARSGRLPDRLEERDQLLGDGLGCEQRGKVPEARQFAYVWVGYVLGDVLHRIGEPGVEFGLLPPQEQDGRGDLLEYLGVSRPGTLVARRSE